MTSCRQEYPLDTQCSRLFQECDSHPGIGSRLKSDPGICTRTWTCACLRYIHITYVSPLSIMTGFSGGLDEYKSIIKNVNKASEIECDVCLYSNYHVRTSVIVVSFNCEWLFKFCQFKCKSDLVWLYSKDSKVFIRKIKKLKSSACLQWNKNRLLLQKRELVSPMWVMDLRDIMPALY